MPHPVSPHRVRTATLADVPRLVALNAAAYPDLLLEGVVFDAAQLRAQQAVFPEGQLVVERAGTVVGALATLIVPSAAALAPHSWSEITSYGTFARHAAGAAGAEGALYLADVYSDPDARGTGLGASLYEVLFELCVRKNLARVVAGGRLWGYHEVRAEMTPEDYAAAVVEGRRSDRVLSSQLRAGFRYRGILVDYLEDWRSASFATLLVWDNPNLRRGVHEVEAAAGRGDFSFGMAMK